MVLAASTRSVIFFFRAMPYLAIHVYDEEDVLIERFVMHEEDRVAQLESMLLRDRFSMYRFQLVSSRRTVTSTTSMRDLTDERVVVVRGRIG